MTQSQSFIIPDWPAPSWVCAASTTRLGGQSKAPYTSFNLAQHVGDDAKNVENNRALLGDTLSLPTKPSWLTQIHGKHVVDISDDYQAEADAAFTRQAEKVCVVMTADCLPLLLCHQQEKVVATIHVGWRGLAAGIIEATLACLNVDNNQFMAWLGPAISAQHFEVGLDVYEALAIDEASKQCFSEGRWQHWYADLYGLARLRLMRAGVKAVYGGTYCTFGDDERFFSHRRDGISGRMASLIWMQT